MTYCNSVRKEGHLKQVGPYYCLYPAHGRVEDADDKKDDAGNVHVDLHQLQKGKCPKNARILSKLDKCLQVIVKFLDFDPIQNVNHKNLLKGKCGQIDDDGDDEDEVEGGEGSGQKANLRIQTEIQIQLQKQTEIQIQLQKQTEIQIQLQKQTEIQIQLQKQT